MAPTVSIGIPTFNRPAFLTQAIQGVLRQTFQDFEIIISDDCSTDNTPEVARGIGDPRIHYHRTQTNLRPPRNWNECVRLAQGEFFALLPDDDAYFPNFLAEMVSALRAQPEAAFAQCAYYIADEQLRCLTTVQAARGPFTMRGADALHWHLETMSCMPVALLFRRTAMCALGLWREDYWDDWAFIIRLAYRFGFTFVPQLLAVNRVHNQNLNRKLYREGIDVIQQHISQQADVFSIALPMQPKTEALSARLNRGLSQHSMLLAGSAVIHGHWRKAPFHLVRAYRLYALAWFDPRFVALWWRIRNEVRQRREWQDFAQHRRPLLQLDIPLARQHAL
jgi:glycosyltransferase involved in cell wall biosynthesis